MTVKTPSKPTHLHYDDGRLSFASPLYKGGGKISKYEVFQLNKVHTIWDAPCQLQTRAPYFFCFC